MQKRKQHSRSSSDPVPPDFALVEPITYRRDLLSPQGGDGKEEIMLKRFAIVLGLAVNELKDIDWGHHQITKQGKPKQKKHLGQFPGTPKGRRPDRSRP